MKKIEKKQLGKTSYLLIIAASISLFMLIAFFSYSLYGGKGTYSASVADYECSNSSYVVKQHGNLAAYYCCPSGWTLTSPAEGAYCRDSTYTLNLNSCSKQYTFSTVESCDSSLVTFKSQNSDYTNIVNKCSPDYKYYTVYYPLSKCEISAERATLKPSSTGSGTGLGCYACTYTGGGSSTFWSGTNPTDSARTCNKQSDGSACGYACFTINGTRVWSNNPSSNYTLYSTTMTKEECIGNSGNTLGDGDNGKITLRSTSNYPWADGSVDTMTIDCNKTTNVSEVNSWLKNSPDVWWCGTSKTIKSYFDNGECNMSFYPCAKSGSDTPGYVPSSDGGNDNPTGGNNGGTGTGGSTGTDGGTGTGGDTEKPTNPGVEFSDTINGDRCYNGTWVRVLNCQPRSVSGAQCKLSDGRLVLRQDGGLTEGYGCSDLPDAYSDTIDDYRCNKSTGKWIHVKTCQPRNLIGAKCKTESDSIIRTNVTFGNGCSGTKPGSSSTDSGSSNESQSSVDRNPQTGTIELVVSLIIAGIALFVSFYYFRRDKLLNK